MGKPTRFQIMTEANKRMNILAEMGYLKEAVNAFYDNGIICISDSQPTIANGNQRIAGIVYSLDEFERCEPEAVEAIRTFEAEMGGYAYAAIFSVTSFGKMVSILYVSTFSSEWKRDKEELREGNPFVYVANIDKPKLSDYCYIVITCSDGGLLRQ